MTLLQLANSFEVGGDGLEGIEFVGFFELLDRGGVIRLTDKEASVGEMGGGGVGGETLGLLEEHDGFFDPVFFLAETGEKDERLPVEGIAGEPLLDELRSGFGVAALEFDEGAAVE